MLNNWIPVEGKDENFTRENEYATAIVFPILDSGGKKYAVEITLKDPKYPAQGNTCSSLENAFSWFDEIVTNYRKYIIEGFNNEGIESESESDFGLHDTETEDES